MMATRRRGALAERRLASPASTERLLAIMTAPTTGPLRLHAAPNPLRSSTTISFTLPAPARAIVEVFDLSGRRVARSSGLASRHAVPMRRS